MAKYAINNNGTITVSEGIPNTFLVSGGAVIGGGSTLSQSEASEKGFFPVVMPEDYDERIHDLSEIFFVSKDQHYTYTKSNKSFSQNLDDLKASKIANLKSQANSKLQPTDWYVIRYAEDNSKTIPSEIATSRSQIKTNVETKEAEILALTTKASCIIYDINLD